MCSKVIVRSEISRVVYDVEYRDTSGLALLKRAGIEVFSLKELLGKAS
jgi:deoxycytidylate deaminase